MLYLHRCLSALVLIALLPSALRSQSDYGYVETISAAGTVVPFVEVFDVTTTGEYEIVVSDFGVAATPVPPAAAVYTLITRTNTNEVVARLTGPGTSTAVLEATEYQLTLIATPDIVEPRSSIGVGIVAQAGGSAVLERVVAFDGGLAVENPVAMEHDFMPQDAARYEFTIMDTGFPDSLAAIETIILRAGDGSPLATVSGAGTAALDLNAGEGVRIVFVATRADENDRALLVVNVSRDGVSAATFPARIGDWATVVERPMQVLEGGIVVATVTDFALPRPVAELSTLIIQGGMPAVGPVQGSGLASGSLSGGPALLLAAADDTAIGTAGFNVVGPGDNTLLDEVVAFDADAGVTDKFAAIDAVFSVAAADALTFTVRDFRFPSAFSSVVALIARDGTEIARLDAPGTLTVDVEPGNFSVAVLGELSQGSSGLLALGISTSDSTVLVEDFAAGGGTMRSLPVTVAGDRLLRLDLTDLEFPAAFVSLDAALIRGTDLVGSAFGGGRVVFDALAGDYTLHLFARPDETVGHSTYSVAIGAQPQAPEATLTSDRSSVPVGGSVELTWDAQFVDDCVASGSWSGSKGASGNERISDIQSEMEFRLTCTGPGGATEVAVAVAVTAATGGSGGTDGVALAVLLLFALRCARQLASR